MPYNGTTGLFTPVYNWQQDKINGIKIRADRMDGQDQDIATGLTTAVTKDGQTTPTANLPMGTFKHTGVGAATNATDYLRADQAQGNSLIYFTTGGAADVYTLTPVPAIAAYAGGQAWLVKISAANLTTTPTIAVSGLAAKTIVLADGTAVSAGDLALGGVYEIVYEATAGKFFMPNRSTVSFATDAQTKTGTSTAVALQPANLASVLWAIEGKRTSTGTGAAMVAFTRYRITASVSMSLPTMAANEYLIVERDTNAGSVTITRNSQTIDGVSADFVMDVDKDIILFFCDSVGVVITRYIGVVPT